MLGLCGFNMFLEFFILEALSRVVSEAYCLKIGRRGRGEHRYLVSILAVMAPRIPMWARLDRTTRRLLPRLPAMA